MQWHIIFAVSVLWKKMIVFIDLQWYIIFAVSVLQKKEYEIQQLKIQFEKSQLNQILLTDKEMYGSLY